MEVPDKVGRASARPKKCHIRKGVEIYLCIGPKPYLFYHKDTGVVQAEKRVEKKQISVIVET